MYFVLVKEIESGKIIDKAELSSADNIGNELARLALLTRKQFENRYPADKYSVSYDEANSWEELQNKLRKESSGVDQPGDEKVFTMIGSRTYLFMVNIGSMIMGIFLIFFLLVIRLIYNPFVFILCMFILFGYLYIDFKRWIKNGIQMVKIDKEGLTVYRGNKMQPTRIDARQITGINVFKKINRRVVNILLGGYADSSLPGITFFSGPRIRITDDAFAEAEFGIFINKLKELKPELINQL